VSCESTREQMMEIDADEFVKIDHLRDCDACSALADQIRTAEANVADHVEAFEQQGQFDAHWEAARAQIPPPQEKPRVRWYVVAGPLLAAAAVLLLLLPPGEPETPLPPPKVPSPVVAPEAPVAAEPAPEIIEPRPSPARRPSPAPPPPPPPEPLLTIRGLPAEVVGLEAVCPSGLRVQAAVSGGVGRLTLAAGESCAITLQGLSASPIEGGAGEYDYSDGLLLPR